MPPRRRAGAQTAAVRADLELLPVELRSCAEAEAAVALGRNIDSGIQVAASVKELRSTLASLRARALALTADPVLVGEDVDDAAVDADMVKEASPVADLVGRIAARRGAASG